MLENFRKPNRRIREKGKRRAKIALRPNPGRNGAHSNRQRAFLLGHPKENNRLNPREQIGVRTPR